MKSVSRIKSLFTVYFIAAVDNCGYAMVFVLFPSLLLNPDYGFLRQDPSLTTKLLAIGTLYAAFPIAQLIGAPIMGELADRYGRKKIFFVSIILVIGAYFLTGLVLMVKSIFLLFVARFLTGLFSGNQGLCNASIADLSPNEKQRARNYGILTVVWGVSFPIALILGGFLSDPSLSKWFNPSLPFYVAGILTTLSLVSLAVFFSETYQRAEGKTKIDLSKGIHNIIEALRMRDTRRFFFLLLLWTLGWGYSITWYGAYVIKHFGISQKTSTLGLMIQGTGWALGGSLVNPILLRLMNTWSIAKLSYLLTALLLTAAAFMPNFSSFIFTYAISAIVGAVSLSSTFNLISISSAANVQGKAMGIAQSMFSLGLFLVPILGALTGAISIYTFYPISALFLFLGLYILQTTKKAF